MRHRIEAGPLIGALGALLLLVSLFLDWFEPDLSAWTVFEVLDLLLAALALAALVPLARALTPNAPPGPRRDLLIIGLAALVVVASQLIQHPPAAVGRAPELGAWLGLGGAALMAIGGALAEARISLALDVEPRERAAPPPHAEAASEAAAVEPEVQDELYPEPRGNAPLGSDDPEPWRAGPEDETAALGDEPPPPPRSAG
ncbi:MAG: hypothetical protein ACJ76V_05975 [Thermoleophilaceae bacterium]